MAPPIFYDLVSSADIPAAHALEIAGFPADEAASLEAFQYRQAQAPDLFLGAYTSNPDGSRTLVGYTCSTLSPDEVLTHGSMSTHVPDSSSICIHSICVSSQHRRQGVALGILKEYVARLQKASQEGAPYRRILLITHQELIDLYSKAGFENVGQSAVVHGSRPWFEMRISLDTSGPVAASAAAPQQVPAGLWEVLQRSSATRARPSARLFLTFRNGASDVLLDNDKNKFDLLCPREGCGSVILLSDVATLVNGARVQLEPEGRQNPHLAPIGLPSGVHYWWKIVGTAMAFENIGFSRPATQIANPTGSGKSMKLLLCAECELGPLGWCEEGGSEFWLAATRVGYKA